MPGTALNFIVTGPQVLPFWLCVTAIVPLIDFVLLKLALIVTVVVTPSVSGKNGFVVSRIVPVVLTGTDEIVPSV